MTVTVTAVCVGGGGGRGGATLETSMCIGILKMPVGPLILKNLGVLGINSRTDSSSGALPNRLHKNKIARSAHDNRARKPKFCLAHWNTSFLSPRMPCQSSNWRQ